MDAGSVGLVLFFSTPLLILHWPDKSTSALRRAAIACSIFIYGDWNLATLRQSSR
jgi:hypothetical protein